MIDHFSHWEERGERGEADSFTPQEHSWDCVRGQRPVRLGFMSHPAGSEKVLGKVSSLSSLCLAPCCLTTNTRLFGCVRPCCWGRVSLSDSRCVETCCGGTGIPSKVSHPHLSSRDLYFHSGETPLYRGGGGRGPGLHPAQPLPLGDQEGSEPC